MTTESLIEEKAINTEPILGSLLNNNYFPSIQPSRITRTESRNLMDVSRKIKDIGFVNIADTAKWLLQEFILFPISYNQVIVTGISAYCIELLPKLNFSSPDQLGQHVNSILIRIQNLYFQQSYSGLDSFALIDLQVLEDKFELIQKKSKELNLLPELDQLEIHSM